MSDQSSNNSTLMILVLGGIGLGMCACILLGAFMFLPLNINQSEIAIDPAIEPTQEQAIQSSSDVADRGTNTSVFDLREGTCFNDPVTVEEDLVEELAVVSCNTPHDNEVFALVNYPDGSEAAFPGTETINEFAETECEAIYYTYVGTAYADSLFLYSTYYPSEESWSDGDREVICFLYHPDLEKLTDSQKGSNK